MNFNQRQKEYYNRIAPRYDKLLLFDRDNRNQILRTKAIMDSLVFKKDYTILEVGMGTGITARHILSTKPYKSFTGTDISEGMLGMASTSLNGILKVTLKVADMEKLPFDDESFDIVYCCDAIHHANNPFKGMEEIARVLKKGRRMVLVEPNKYYLLGKVIFPFRFDIENWSDQNTKEMINAKIEGKLVKIGLKDVSVRNMIYTIPKPDFLFPFYNKVNAVMGRLPVLRRISTNLLIQGRKE